MVDSEMEYAQLTAGFEFAPSSFKVDKETVFHYLNATDDDNPFYRERLVPPMAVAALALKEMAKRFVIPPGTLHVSQQLEFIKPVNIGEILTSTSKVVRKVERGKFRMLNIGIQIVNQKKDIALTGEVGFVLPSSFVE